MSCIPREITWNESDSGCWECTSHKPDSNGYPRVRRGGRSKPLSRYMYERFVSAIPRGMVIRHKCDNRLCINPQHLETGTPADNTSDRHSRGRTWSKLSAGQVWEILTSEDRAVDLAIKYNVSPSNISKIRTGASWAKPTVF